MPVIPTSDEIIKELTLPANYEYIFNNNILNVEIILEKKFVLK